LHIHIPVNYKNSLEDKDHYLNKLNDDISNAIVNEKYCLRASVVNFRTSKKDIKRLLK